MAKRRCDVVPLQEGARVSLTDELSRVSAAYHWHRALGNICVEGAFCQFVKDPDHPDVWSANHVAGVRAETEKDIAAVFHDMERHFTHCAHRLVSTDPLTPPNFIAHLAMRDYRELTPTLQMVLSGDLTPIDLPAVTVTHVETKSHWRQIESLVRADHREGARTHRTTLSEQVSRGIVAGMRKKSGPCAFFLAVAGGEPCAYGAAVRCPNGLGMVEDIFTLPAYRGRGIASAMIGHCVRTLRAAGQGDTFLGAHIAERPKHLYQKLGFAPLMLTREFILDRSSSE